MQWRGLRKPGDLARRFDTDAYVHGKHDSSQQHCETGLPGARRLGGRRGRRGSGDPTFPWDSGAAAQLAVAGWNAGANGRAGWNGRLRRLWQRRRQHHHPWNIRRDVHVYGDWNGNAGHFFACVSNIHSGRELERVSKMAAAIGAVIPQGLKRLREKGGISDEIGGKYPSGTKAHVDSIAFAARLKSCPFKAMSFSASCEVAP